MKMKKTLMLALILVLIVGTSSVFAAEYTVKAGDTLSKIAKEHSVTVDQLVQINKISNRNLIYVGQVVKTTMDGLEGTLTKPMPAKIAAKMDIDENGGADAYDNAGDHENSKYYVNPDFYNMKSDSNLTIINHFKTYQQTSEWSCGNAATLMVLEHFGVDDYTEWDIAVKSNAGVDLDTAGALPGTANNFPEYGTSVDDIVRFFEGMKNFDIVETSYVTDYKASDLIQEGDKSVPWVEWGNLPGRFNAVSLYASDNNPNTENWVDNAKDSYFVKWITNHLKANRPILVEWADWDGHWQAIIGYDTNGTPSIGDDVIIFADPYDTSDHWQDGYYYYPAERWFYMWSDRAVAPKPYQLQSYVVVEPSK